MIKQYIEIDFAGKKRIFPRHLSPPLVPSLEANSFFKSISPFAHSFTPLCTSSRTRAGATSRTMHASSSHWRARFTSTRARAFPACASRFGACHFFDLEPACRAAWSKGYFLRSRENALSELLARLSRLDRLSAEFSTHGGV